MSLVLNKLYCKDCLIGLDDIPERSVNLIVTSPPYAEQRKETYQGIPEDKYIEWFIPIVNKLSKVIAEDGSFILNIKDHSINGFRSSYTLRTILAIIDNTPFNLIDTFAWTKQAFPHKVVNKFRNGWEPVYHFAINKDIKIRPERVKVPASPLTRLRAKYKQSTASANGSGYIQPNLDKFKDMQDVFPMNVIHAPNIMNQHSLNRWHSAVFPPELVKFFVLALSDENDVILDPFAGSATTLVVAKEYNRNYLGFEINKYYCDKVKETYNIDCEI